MIELIVILPNDFLFLYYEICDLGRPRVVKRTLKYFMGILNRAWIVNTDWVRECVTSKRLLDEVILVVLLWFLKVPISSSPHSIISTQFHRTLNNVLM